MRVSCAVVLLFLGGCTGMLHTLGGSLRVVVCGDSVCVCVVLLNRENTVKSRCGDMPAD